MILAGDTGGTKTVLALCDEQGHPGNHEVFHCAEYDSLETIVDRFLRDTGSPAISGACFGVAGPVVGGVAKITNLPWSISAASLSTKLGGIPVSLLNDLQATALGMLVLPPSSFAVLQPPAQPAPHATIAVVAPGTGFGESLLVSDGTRYTALPSEGGHADFAPGNDEEVELWRFLQRLHGRHVSWERILSGAGIGDLYSFAREQSRVPEPAWLTEAIAAGDRNAVVSQTAIAGKDPAAVHALEMFAALLGAEAGNHALRGLATGGVVIGGGISPKVLPALQAGGLLARFRDKGRFAPWIGTLSLRVCLDERAAIHGAAYHVVASRGVRA